MLLKNNLQGLRTWNFQVLLLSMIPRNGENLKSFWESLRQILGDIGWNDPNINRIYIYGLHYWRIIWSSYRKFAWVGSRRSNRLSYQAMSSTCTQSLLCTATPISPFVQCLILFRLLPPTVATFILIWSFLEVIISGYK